MLYVLLVLCVCCSTSHCLSLSPQEHLKPSQESDGEYKEIKTTKIPEEGEGGGGEQEKKIEYCILGNFTV